MLTDKEILFNMIGRYIDNICYSNPAIGLFSGTIKKYVFNFLEPYVDLFMQEEQLEIDVASSFVKQEMINKIDTFKKEFKDKVNYEKQDYI